MRPESIKLLKENIGNMLSETDLSNIFTLDLSPQTRATGKQTGLHQTKKSCTAKETINKTKRQLPESKKPCANDTPDKGLISKIYEELIQQKKKKSNFKNWLRNLTHIFPDKTYRWPTDT